jgi:uncharacterized repeat protein (TIGR01451 family)
MLIRKLAIALLVLGIVGITNRVFAQGNADQQKSDQSKTFFERLDDFGKSIFGGRTEKKSKDAATAKTDSRSSARKPTESLSQDDVTTSSGSTARAGSILAGSDGDQTKLVATDSEIGMDSASLTVPRSADGTPKPVRRPLASKSLLDESVLGDPAQKPAPVGQSQKAAGMSLGISSDLPEAGSDKSGSRTLSERLAGVRQSVFGPDPKPEPQPEVQPAPASKVAAEASPKALESKPSPRALDSDVVKLAGRPIAAQRVTPASSANEAATAEPALGPVSNAPAAVKSDGNGMLFAHKGPLVSVETAGPRRITVGKESTYEVSVVNLGDVAADDLVVFVTLPETAEVIGAEASAGATQPSAAQQPAGTMQWVIKRLDVKARERLVLRIIPRQSRPFDLAVRWESKPAASQAMIEVQEPKLLLQLEGPREVLYGKQEMFRLKLTNTGNGAAENAAIMLMPIGTGENVPASHKIGTLAAGAEKVLDVELTARQTGSLAIHVEARADGAQAELSETVLVRRPALKIDVEGPKVQYLGAVATYVIRVRNTGTAPARNVNLSIMLPPGAKYLSGIDGARLDAAEDKVEWTVDSINPELEQSVAMRCSLATPGANRVQINATADCDLTASMAAVTQVDAVANLVMDVKNPEGPVPVGEEATYEVRLRNRGTKAAENVEVFAYLSNGIEPTAAEGGPNQLKPGEVAFAPITSLPAGAEAILKVHARAEVGGNHVFRAETHCKALGARLVSEVTNLYYADVSSDQKMAQDEVTASDGVRTVNRAMRIEQTPALPRQ